MKFYPLTVDQVIDETPLARSFTLTPKNEHRHLFTYEPGQYLLFRVPWNDGISHERCYSLSSSPDTNSDLKVTVKRVTGGKISNWFNDCLISGDRIDVAPPAGRFVTRDTNSEIVLFAGGSGITPIISIIKHVMHQNQLSARLFYANASSEQIIFKKELNELGARFPARFHCIHHLDSNSGFVDAPAIKQFMNNHRDSQFFICGPGPFMDLVENTLSDLGVADQRVFVERFSSPDDPNVNEVSMGSSLAGDVTTFKATIDDEDHEVPYIAGETLLECMLASGLEPVFSCRDAHCGSCMVVKKAGEVSMRKSTVLSKRDREKGYILLCQAFPQSKNIWIDCDV